MSVHPRLEATGAINKARAELSGILERLAAEHELSAPELLTILISALPNPVHELLVRDLDERFPMGKRP